MNDNTVLFSSLLLDACIVPVSVPVCHLDSRQLQQQPPPSLMNNQQHQLQHQQNNPPHLAYQQANHHSYTTVTTSNQHGPSHLPPGGGVMGAHQQGPVPPHLQQQVSPPPLFREISLCAFSSRVPLCLEASLRPHFLELVREYVEILEVDGDKINITIVKNIAPSAIDGSLSIARENNHALPIFPFDKIGENEICAFYRQNFSSVRIDVFYNCYVYFVIFLILEISTSN